MGMISAHHAQITVCKHPPGAVLLLLQKHSQRDVLSPRVPEAYSSFRASQEQCLSQQLSTPLML